LSPALKIVETCDLPLTGAACVQKIITDLAVFDIIDSALVLRAIAPEVSVEQLREKTGAPFIINLQEVAL
jgi:3-oxoacid CoA-transferase subunit B